METASARKNVRAFLREMGGAMLAYTVILVLVLVFVDFDTAGAWKFGAALLPMIPAGFAVAAVVRHIARVDEMQRQIVVSGMSLGFGVAVASAATFGFLQMAGLDTQRWGPWAIFGLAMLAWVIGSMRYERRLG